MRLGIVVPCYNEEDVLDETVTRLLALLARLVQARKVAEDSAIWLVDDGSRDRTWPMIARWADRDSRVAGVKLSRNQGHQNALLAGLFTAEGDALVSVDADLQDDLAAIEHMVDEFRGGSDVVYGVRRTRSSDSAFKRGTAQAFYRLMSILGAESIHNHADFRLMSRRAVESLKDFREVNLFLRGIVPLIGLPSAIVHYDRHERFAGESKYPLRRMLSLAWNAITSFSVVPLRAITVLGFVVFVATLVLGFWVIGVRLFTESAVPGWASTVLPIYFIGGIQILCLGIIGEYLGKIYREVKSRPRYFIEKRVGRHAPPLPRP